jgi:hypothetical protein
MQPYTGEIVSDINSLPKDLRSKYVEVPKHLQAEAERELAERGSTTINLNAQTNLAKFAAKVRKKNRVRNKIAKRARKRNG